MCAMPFRADPHGTGNQPSPEERPSPLLRCTAAGGEQARKMKRGEGCGREEQREPDGAGVDKRRGRGEKPIKTLFHTH